MHRIRKHIYWLDLDDLIGTLEQFQVPGQSHRVAGYIDDPLWCDAFDGRDKLRGRSLSGRIHDDKGELLIRLKHELRTVAFDEMSIGDVVHPGIEDGIMDGVGDDFDAGHFLDLVGKAESDRTGSAIGIQDSVILLQVGKFDSLPIEGFYLMGIDLIEGLGGNQELLIKDLVLNLGMPVYRDIPFTEDDVGLPVIDIQDKADDLRNLLHEFLGKLLDSPDVASGDDQSDQGLILSRICLDEDMPYKTELGILMIWRIVILFKHGDQNGSDFVGKQSFHQAVIDTDEIVRSRLIEAGLDLLFLVVEANRLLDLVSEPGRLVKADAWLDINIDESKFMKKILDLLRLIFELLGIAQVHDLTSAAVRIILALGMDPVRAVRISSDDFGLG